MIGAILRLFNGGLETYRQHKEIKANELKRQDELKAVQHAAQVERIKAGDEAATQLDEVSIAQRGWKDEYLMILTTLPLGLSFVPEWAHIVDAGFAALENVPEYYWYALGMIYIDTFGFRRMVRTAFEHWLQKSLGGVRG